MVGECGGESGGEGERELQHGNDHEAHEFEGVEETNLAIGEWFDGGGEADDDDERRGGEAEDAREFKGEVKPQDEWGARGHGCANGLWGGGVRQAARFGTLGGGVFRA